MECKPPNEAIRIQQEHLGLVSCIGDGVQGAQRSNPQLVKAPGSCDVYLRWDARRAVKMKAQQPDGCEHFIKPPNAADRSKTHYKLSRSMSLKYL